MTKISLTQNSAIVVIACTMHQTYAMYRQDVKLPIINIISGAIVIEIVDSANNMPRALASLNI